jgi:hypothetical protein
MNETERDVHEALGRIVRSGPPPGLRTPEVLAMGRRARRRRSLLAGGGTVAGVLAVVAAAAVLAPAGSGRGATEPGAGLPPHSRTSPAPGADWEQPAVPGMSPAEVRRIARGCAESYGGRGGRIGPGSPDPDPTLVNDPSAPLLADVVRVHNVVRDAAGTAALLYGPGVVLICQVGGPGLPYNAGGGIGGAGLPQWLPGPVSIDDRSSTGGGGKHPGTRASDLVAGRVVGTVTRVTVRYGSATTTVPAVNGTYLVRFVHGVGAPVPGGDRGLTVRAYDAAGDLVGEARGTSLDDCYVTPDGAKIKISGDRTNPDQACKPAVRWRVVRWR